MERGVRYRRCVCRGRSRGVSVCRTEESRRSGYLLVGVRVTSASLTSVGQGAPRRFQGGFPTPGDHGPLRPAAPEVGPRGCPPPLGLTAPPRRGGFFLRPVSSDEDHRGPSFRSVPRECIPFRFRKLTCSPCRTSNTYRSVGLAVERVSVLLSGQPGPVRTLDRFGTSADGRREPSPAEVGSRPDLGGRRPSPGWCAEHVSRRRCLRHHRGTSWVTPRARSSRAVPRGRRARRGAGRVR